VGGNRLQCCQHNRTFIANQWLDGQEMMKNQSENQKNLCEINTFL